MTVPGSNLLKRAQTVIHREEFTYYPYLSRVETDIGTLVSSYGPGVTIRDTVQPIAQSLQRQLRERRNGVPPADPTDGDAP